MGDRFKRRLAILIAGLVTALGAQSFIPSAAQAVTACPDDNICTYEVYLAFAGGIVNKWHRNTTTCLKVYPDRTYSVKNETPYDYRAFHNSVCSYTSDTSVLYAETDGNMNSSWNDDQLGSIRRLL